MALKHGANPKQRQCCVRLIQGKSSIYCPQIQPHLYLRLTPRFVSSLSPQAPLTEPKSLCGSAPQARRLCLPISWCCMTSWKLLRTPEHKNMSKILFDMPKEVFNNVALRLNKYLWWTGRSYLLFIYFCARNAGHPLHQALSQSFLTHLETSLYLLEMIIIPLASIEFHELKSSANPYHIY